MSRLSHLCALLVVLAPGVRADEPDESETDRKTVVKPPPTSPATSVIGRDRLSEKAGADLPMALSGEPGVHIPRLGGLGSYATVSIRGSTPEQVLVTLDGIPLNPADGAPVDLSTLPVGPLSFVAIHRGRAPWSLGLTGLGGALRLETARSRETSASVELGGGSFSTRFLRVHAGVKGIAASAEHLGTAGDFRYHDDGGTAWTAADDRTTTRQNAASLQTSALVRTDFELGPLDVTLLDTFTHVARGLPSLGVTPTRESSLRIVRNLIGFRMSGTPGPLALSLMGSFAWAETEVSDPRSEIGLSGDEETTTSLLPHTVASLALPLGRSFLQTHLALRHEAIAGATDFERTVGSLAAEFHTRVSDLTLALGLRLERGPDLTAPSAFAEVAVTLDHVRLHAALHHTPRLPSLFERHGNLGLVLGNPDLTPEALSQLELGVRVDLVGDDLSAHLVALAHGAFATDLIQFIQNAQGIARPENLASARILGLELAAELHLGAYLSLRSSLALLDARDTSDIVARTGNRLPLRPSLTTAHRLEVAMPIPEIPEGALGLSIDLDHVAGNTLDAANLVLARPRTLLGTSVFVRSDELEVRLSLMNLSSSDVTDMVGYPLPGMTALVALRWFTP